ncbi:MAG: ABC transporter substrate-binding protein, partial [Betaproteobacteria bacterium]|nr:ABC transporter substrate-binding protein [Betaproteobacteria bacterium]
MRALLGVLAAAAVITASNLNAATLRWSAAGELVTCDPHSVVDTAGLVMTSHMYEKLVEFDRDYKLAPALA